MVKSLKWFAKSDELLKCAIEFQKDEKLDQQKFLDRLEQILPNSGKTIGVAIRSIYFLEFCFYRAEGPYSRKFNYYASLLKKIFAIYSPLKRLINSSGDAALANMVLGAKGNLKFEISDLYELKKVLEIWELVGLKRQTLTSVFNAVMNKNKVQEDIKHKNIFLLARLRVIFPMFMDQYLPEVLDLDAAIFDHFKKRFAPILKSYEDEGLDITAMIHKENERIMPVGIFRNNLLAYLIKKKHNFACQICYILKNNNKTNQNVEVHHIVPLKQGGQDKAENMIVLCKKHHHEAHQGQLILELGQKIHIEYEGKSYNSNPN